MKRQQTGKLAELIAREYLEREGHHVLTTNWRCPEGEIDIICRKGDEIVFVEVRAKSSGEFGTPAESITRRKQEKLVAAAERYIEQIGDTPPEWRIDFIGVEFGQSGHRLDHIKSAVSGIG